MPKLIITRGLQASGKSTLARAHLRNHPLTVVGSNRDLLRKMLNAGAFVKGREGTEKIVTRIQHVMISDSLLAGKDVICDDTNLRERTVQDLHVLAWTHGAELVIWDLCHVPLNECIRRDRARGETDPESVVGEQVIRSYAQKYLNGGVRLVQPDWRPHTTLERIERYVPDPRLPAAVLLDLDGTAALHVARSPYDYSRVSTDAPNPGVVRIVQAVRAAKIRIIAVSGRPDGCRQETERWLDEHVRDWDELHMRPEGDTRNDAIIKIEIFDREIRHRYNVIGALDDRNRVVRAYRTLGLTVLQVADGNF